MQLYFIKATFTNNVYKLSDFFVGSNYNLIATKMLDINFRPDDGLSSFITSKIILPDTTKIWDHTHIIVPEYNKIYRIASIDYVNNDQYNVTLDEDPLIANYKELETKDIILMRSNDASLFRGLNDISDLTVKETVETKTIESTTKTGKWALVFMTYDSDDEFIGLRFQGTVFPANRETFANLSALTTAYPEVNTSNPSTYEYFQKIVTVTSESKDYQCVYDGSGTNTRLYWVEYVRYEEQNDVYLSASYPNMSKINPVELTTICLALPFENDIFHLHEAVNDRVMSYNEFVGPIDSGRIIDIKIVDDLFIKGSSVSYSLTGRVMTKVLTLQTGAGAGRDVLMSASVPSQMDDYTFLFMYNFKDTIDISANFDSSLIPTKAEPFNKYDLYIFGKKFIIPYYLSNDIKIKMAINTGVINYIIYFNNPRNILASGSYTHSIRYQVDNLDAFYNQNPTYKEQFFTKMAIDSMKGIVGGAVAGSVVPGLGTMAGAGLGLASAGLDAGISMLNLYYQEKGLKLKPDQVFGEISEVSLQVINIFGIYWVKRTSENADLMKIEYDMRGFPTLFVKKINTLTGATGIFGTAKVIYGELKGVVRNEFVTGFINNKLKEGIVII